MKHQFKASRHCVALLTLVSAAHAQLIVGEAQFNGGNVLPDPIIAVSGDLLETSVALATGENEAANPRDGLTGTAHEQSDAIPAEVWMPEVAEGELPETVYEFDLNASPQGYDISEIRMFSGWMDSRAGQSYTLDYSVVGEDEWINLGTVSELISNGSLLTRTYDAAGGLIASGVDAIRMIQVDTGTVGSGTVFREIDVIGTARGSNSSEISDIFYDRDASTVTLTWNSQPGVTYSVNYSLDLIDWDSALNDAVTSANDQVLDDGNNITVTFNLDGDLEGLPRLFFRVEN